MKNIRTLLATGLVGVVKARRLAPPPVKEGARREVDRREVASKEDRREAVAAVVRLRHPRPADVEVSSGSHIVRRIPDLL
jgi:hypothetical protein